MSVHEKVHAVLRTALQLETFPVITYAAAPEPDGTGNYREVSVGPSTIRADSMEAAPIGVVMKDAEDSKLFGEVLQDVDNYIWVLLIDFRQPVDIEPFIHKLGRTIPMDNTLKTPILYLRVSSVDITFPPANDPSSGAHFRLELEVRPAPVASG